jgi:hypothetical protein
VPHSPQTQAAVKREARRADAAEARARHQQAEAERRLNDALRQAEAQVRTFALT